MTIPALTTRRSVLCGLAGVATYTSAPCREEGSGGQIEEQRGDIDSTYESLNFDRSYVQQMMGPTRANFEPRAENFAALVATTAQEFVGRSRENDAESIGSMLELFNLPFQYSAGAYVPFCAAGLAHVVAVAYCRAWRRGNSRLSTLMSALPDVDHYHFFPSASVWHMYQVAQAKGRWAAKDAVASAKPGWLVVYDFGKGADHVGFVLDADGSRLKTFECNTSGVSNGSQRNGGVIAIKERTLTHVKGYIRTDLVRAV